MSVGLGVRRVLSCVCLVDSLLYNHISHPLRHQNKSYLFVVKTNLYVIVPDHGEPAAVSLTHATNRRHPQHTTVEYSSSVVSVRIGGMWPRLLRH